MVSGEEFLRAYNDSATERGTLVVRKFCSNCGSPVLFGGPSAPDRIAVASGTIDGDIPLSWKPDKEFFCKDRARWLGPVEETQCFEGMPPPTVIFPEN